VKLADTIDWESIKKETVAMETPVNKKKCRQLKRCSSIEPAFSRAKEYHVMQRNFLKGVKGDLLDTAPATCSYNLKKIYNKFRKVYEKKLSLLFLLFFHGVTGSEICPVLLRR
jgi:hypothetical protein